MPWVDRPGEFSAQNLSHPHMPQAVLQCTETHGGLAWASDQGLHPVSVQRGSLLLMGSWDRMDTIKICCLILPPGDKQKFGKITERGTKIPVFNKSEVSLNAQCTGERKKKNGSGCFKTSHGGGG